jgi:hypothetical protein
MSEEINESISQEELKQFTPVVDDEGTIKVDMRQFNERANADTVEEATDVVTDQPAEPVQEVEAEVPPQPSTVQDEEPAEEPVEFLQEITDEEVEEVTEQLQEDLAEAIDKGIALPENIQKVVDFMEETGGSLEDYVKLNTDYASLDENSLLREYYQQANPLLDNEDINFL